MRIVVTRSAGRGAGFLARLKEMGHEVEHVPLTRVEDAGEFPDPSEFDGVLFTSVSAADRVPDGAEWPRVGAVGEATAEALRARGIVVDVVGPEGGAALAQVWGHADGHRLLLPQAESAHGALAESLEKMGAEIVRAVVYRTVPLESVDPQPFVDAGAICFFAPSAVSAYVALGIETNAKFWAHGPTTAVALEEAGLEVALLQL